VLGFFATLVVLAVLLAREGSWVDAAVVVFGGLAFSAQRYLAPWYWLPMLPWALGPARSPSGAMSKTAALARVIMVAMFHLASIASRW